LFDISAPSIIDSIWSCKLGIGIRLSKLGFAVAKLTFFANAPRKYFTVIYKAKAISTMVQDEKEVTT
jgi:hypothetical protein